MTELESYAKAIAKKLKPAMDKAEEPKAQRDIFGTVRAVGSGENISYEVMLDGSDSYTPCTPTVEVHAGDRVVCHIVNHRLIVFSNLTVPSVNDQGYQHVKDIANEANELLDGVSAAAASADKSLAEIIADSVTANDLVSEIETYVGYAEGYTQTLADKVDEVDANAQQGIADIAEDVAAVDEAYKAADAAISAEVARVEGEASEAIGDIADEVTRVEEATTEALEDISESVASAAEAAQEAWEHADDALSAAHDAQDSADVAQHHAEAANTAANDALVQLSTVEDVIGVVNWITEHGTYALTQDVAVDDSKVYYTRSGSGTQADPYLYTPVAEPDDSELSTYYELSIDQALSQYVASHLALTNDGLYVLKDNNGYKLLCSNTGVKVIDPQGHIVATYGESITFDSSRQQYIGNEDAYIVFTPRNGNTPANITIGGSNINLGDSRTLSELLGQVDETLVFDTRETYDQAGENVTITAYLYRGGVDVKTEYPENSFTWAIKHEDSVVPTPLSPGYGYSCTVALADAGYGATVVAKFELPNNSPLLTEDDDELTDSHGNALTGRTPTGDTVRVSDLTVETTVFETDRVMVVGQDDEHLVTIATLKEVFGDGDYERLDNMPSIEGVTLLGDKSFPELGIFKTDNQGYSIPDDYTLTTMDINALWANAQPVG